jgi:hypothetical protein
MSTITIDAVPDRLPALLATPEGMARARAAVLAAFPELVLDTRTAIEKALDEHRAKEKAAWHTREEKLISQAREARRLRDQEQAVSEGI